MPCSQVHDELEWPLRVRAETVGAGSEGREVKRTLAETIEAAEDVIDDPQAGRSRRGEAERAAGTDHGGEELTR